MTPLLKIIAAVLIAPTVFFLHSAGYQISKTHAVTYGNFNTTGGGTYNLQATITSNQTTINLSSFQEPGSNIPYTMSYLNSSIEYATIAPQTSQSEFVSFTGITQNTDGSATLTGVQRGLERSYPYQASSTLALPHAGQSRFILSDAPQVFNSYASVLNPNTFVGVQTFGSTTPPIYDADPVWANFTGLIFASVDYVNSVVSAGAANASETVKGIVQLATATQLAAGTSLGSTLARLDIPNSLATSTPTAACTTGCVPVAVSGKLSQSFINLTQVFAFLAAITAPTSTIGTLNVGSIFATSSIKVNGVNVLTSIVIPHYNLAQTGLTATNAYATSSVVSIPAGILNASSTILVNGNSACSTGATAGNCAYYLRTATGVTLASCSPGVTTSNNFNQSFVFSTVSNNATNSQTTVFNCYSENAGAASPVVAFGSATSAVDFTQALGLVVVVQGAAASVAPIANFTITVNP